MGKARFVFGLLALVAASLGLASPAYGQTPGCTLTAGQIDNGFVQVRRVTADGFSGSAFTTLNTAQPTGETVTVHVSAATRWYGRVTSLADVKIGGEKLQVTGKTRADCSIDAVSVFSSVASASLPGTGTGSAKGAVPETRAATFVAALLWSLGGALLLVGRRIHR